MRDLGGLHQFLGILVSHCLFLSESKYSVDILDRENVSACNSAVTPIYTYGKLSVSSNSPVADPTFYRSLAGAL